VAKRGDHVPICSGLHTVAKRGELVASA